MTMPLPWTVVEGQTGEIADTQVAYRTLMPAAAQAKAGRIAVDTFTRPDSATLDNAETGQSWQLLSGAFAVAGLKASASSTGTVVLDAGTANVDVQALIVPTSGAAGIVVRAANADTDRLAVQLDMTNGFRLNKTVGGTLTTLITVPQAFTAGVTYELRVVVNGDNIKGYLNGGTAPLIDHTLSSGDQTTFGALTRVGVRNTGAATFDDFIVRVAYPVSGGGSAPTLANLPAGSTITVVESGGAYIRPTARTDIIVRFQGSANPGSVALENDEWVKLP